MRHALLRLLTTLTGLMLCANASPAVLEARLTATPSSVPLDVPVELTLHVRNPTSRAQTVPRYYLVRFTDEEGVTRVINLLEHGQATAYSKEEIVLQPGEGVSLAFTGESPGSTFPYSLTQTPPGTYQVEALLFRSRPSPWEPSSTNPELSSSTRFRVVEPVGEDAIVWERIRNASKGHGYVFLDTPERQDIGEWIWREHPSSTYALFVLGRPDGYAESVRRIERVLERLSDRPALRDSLRLDLVRRLNFLSGHEYEDKNDVRAAMRASERAVKEAERLFQSAYVFPFLPIGREARKVRSEIATPADWLEQAVLDRKKP